MEGSPALKLKSKMAKYKRAYIPGATWFFTVNLAKRQNNFWLPLAGVVIHSRRTSVISYYT